MNVFGDLEGFFFNIIPGALVMIFLFNAKVNSNSDIVIFLLSSLLLGFMFHEVGNFIRDKFSIDLLIINSAAELKLKYHKCLLRLHKEKIMSKDYFANRTGKEVLRRAVHFADIRARSAMQSSILSYYANTRSSLWANLFVAFLFMYFSSLCATRPSTYCLIYIIGLAISAFIYVSSRKRFMDTVFTSYLCLPSLR